MRVLLSVLLGFTLAVISPHSHADSEGKSFAITVPQNAASQLKIGANALREALTVRELREQSSTEETSLRVIVAVSNKDARSAPEKPESYAVSVSADKKTVFVNGSDATGAMYGAFDLAEQIAAWPRSAMMGEIHPMSKSPFLEMRGVNMILTVQDIDNSDGAFWSDDYWNTYLDIMARNRYNLLDIHGPCDAVTLTFPSGFGYFVSLTDFPHVGVGAERAAKNLARFREVIRMAESRGIHVAYMNYEASPTIGPWKTRRFPVDERWIDQPAPKLAGPELETYTREAVASFLKQLPELWMFGFRIGESGQPEDFYKKTYLAALAEAPALLKVYLRTWAADPQKVRELAASIKNPFYIEPKYNGEHLGSPYQAALGGRWYTTSGSYENYTDRPQSYRILWQIRARGTHRVFYWGSPDFARRTVRSAKFGNGVGFSMEPMNAYYPAADYLHNNPQTDHHFYKWEVEREWVWHLIWGRTAYDPDVPDQVFVNEFIRYFGAQAGPVVYRALAESSKIVPFVYSYHNAGLDHQEFAPEFENGDHPFTLPFGRWQGTRVVPYGGNNDDFLRVNTLDRTAMASPAVYVDERLRGIVNGKMTPFEAASYLQNAASKSEDDIERAAALNPDAAKNFDCIRMDIHAVAWLGRYYADRIISATHLAFYEQSSNHPSLTQAYEYLTRAMNDWDRLAGITEQHFGTVPEYIRMGVKDFSWRDEGRSLGVDLRHLNDLEKAFSNPPEYAKYQERLGHVPPKKVKPLEALTLTVTAAMPETTDTVYMFYRNSQQLGYTRVDLSPGNREERTWKGIVPADQTVPGYIEYYFGVGPDFYDETIAHRPPYHVLVNNNNTKPVISYMPVGTPLKAQAAKLTVRVEAKGKIKSVGVYYKLMPSYYEWLRIEMHPGGNGNFSAAVPLTPEGILYYFEAVDEDGNATNYPNVLEQTPYLVIDSWMPQAR